MPRLQIATLILLISTAASVVAAEPPRSDEHVHWRPQRDIKSAIQAEIREFEQSLRAKLGRTGLAFQPYAGKQDGPDDQRLADVSVDQIVSAMVKSLDELADRDNRDFLPVFSAYRRGPATSGSDLLSAPVMGPPNLGQLSGNLTFQLQWEASRGHFKRQWNHDEVDEVYQVDLTATLTLGVELNIQAGERLTLISHTISKPIVAGWQTSLVASEGEVQPIIEPAPRRAADNPQ